MTVEQQLRQMGIPEPNVPTLAKLVCDAAVSCLCSTDHILSSVRILAQHGDKAKLRQFKLTNSLGGLLKK